MTDDDIKRLRELAERARKPQGWKRIAFQAARLDEFREAASPDAILTLLDERKALREAARMALREMERAAPLLEMYPDDYGDAINALRAALEGK